MSGMQEKVHNKDSVRAVIALFNPSFCRVSLKIFEIKCYFFVVLGILLVKRELLLFS